MKLSPKLLLVLIIVAGLALGAFVLKGDSSNTQTQTEITSELEADNGDTQGTEETQDLKEYSAEEVAKHNTESDCWTIIDGSVYDLTSYISQHPGNDNILSACGVDATAFFKGEQAGQEGGTNNHRESGRAQSELERLKIGTLKS